VREGWRGLERAGHGLTHLGPKAHALYEENEAATRVLHPPPVALPADTEHPDSEHGGEDTDYRGGQHGIASLAARAYHVEVPAAHNALPSVSVKHRMQQRCVHCESRREALR
jgi:hypothetical protein